VSDGLAILLAFAVFAVPLLLAWLVCAWQQPRQPWPPRRSKK
jgi:hypothetical protein